MYTARVIGAVSLLFCLTSQAEIPLALPNAVHRGATVECEIKPEDVPQAARVTLPQGQGKGRVIFGGGGWKTDLYRKPFIEFVKQNLKADDHIPVILSAATTPDAAAGAYAAWQRGFFENEVPVRPIFTTRENHQRVTLNDPGMGPVKKFEEEKPDPNGSYSKLVISQEAPAPGGRIPSQTLSTNPNDETNIDAIRRAKTAIVIDGGSLGSLDHIAGTRLADEIRKANERGVVIYTSSEGANAAGSVNLSLMWGRRTTGQVPVAKKGLGVTQEVAVSSHVRDPRLISVLGFGKVNKSDDGAVSTFEATNPYAFLAPMRELANRGYETPMFGVPERSAMIYDQGVAEFVGESPESRFYIFDPRYPTTGKCDYYYVKSGAKFDLTTGKVLLPPILGAGNVPEGQSFEDSFRRLLGH